jgi:hypothetical protein
MHLPRIRQATSSPAVLKENGLQCQLITAKATTLVRYHHLNGSFFSKIENTQPEDLYLLSHGYHLSSPFDDAQIS